MANVELWKAPDTKGMSLGDNISSVIEVTNDTSLPDYQKNQIKSAFEAGAYDMATEYTWKRSMVKLKELLSGFGSEFIGDLLLRPDIDEFSVLENVLSDNDAINIAEKLGLLNKLGAMNLRHRKEELIYYFSTQASNNGERLDAIHALPIISDCVMYILRYQDVDSAYSFNNFKDKLLTSTLSISDDTFIEIKNAPLFYLRTISTILLSAIKKGISPSFDNASENMLLIIKDIWDTLGVEDKWKIGNAYKDAVADGNEKVAGSLRAILAKVKGFDFVPENLRSVTFIKAAQKLLNVHYDFNNFYNEPLAIKALANLGTIIPSPAFGKCMQAYICVLMGNYYGVSREAAPIAKQELSKISKDNWIKYFREFIHADEEVLDHFLTKNQVKNLQEFLTESNLVDFKESLSRPNSDLYDAIINNDYNKAITVAKSLRNKLRGE